jgi:hypothetical protein
MIKKRKGIALIAAIMLIVFVSIAILGLSVFIVQWYKQIDVEQKEARCIYNAMAGVNYALYQYRNSAALTNGTTNIDANNSFTVSTVSGGSGGMASAIVINATATTLANSNRRVTTWTIQNNSAVAVTINQVTIDWHKTPKTLTSFLINNVSWWSGSMATPPAVFSVSNRIIPANTTYANNNQINFNSSVAGDTGVTLGFRMTDGTSTAPCTIYPAQASTCVQSGGGLTIKSMGKTAGSNQYRSVQAIYNTTTGNVSVYNEINQTVP